MGARSDCPESPPETGVAGTGRKGVSQIVAQIRLRGARVMLIGYARISTGDQSLDLQRNALQGAGCERIFDDVMSGAKPKRPGLNRCLRALEAGDTLVVWKLDRLARSLKSLIEVMQHLDGRKIGFRSLTQAVDTTTPSGRMMLGILGVVAEFERDLIIERTNAGLQAARERGQTFGRPVVVTPEKLAEAKRLILVEGLSVPKAAKRIGVSPASLYAAIPGGKSALLGERLQVDEIAFPG